MCFIYFYLTLEKPYWLFKVYWLEFDMGESRFNKGAENPKTLGSSDVYHRSTFSKDLGSNLSE
jgi:hypothetical protein